MEFYLEHYFDILINTRDFEILNQLMPSITLDKTNQVLDKLILKIQAEMVLALEYEDVDYENHLKQVVSLLESKKEKHITYEESKSSENILVFSPYFLKSVKQMEDSKNYKAILTAISNLKDKNWMQANFSNTEKYKRLHGVASGLSEVKVFPIRLIHTKINEDFWYVSTVMDKEGNNTKKQQEILRHTCQVCEEEVAEIFEFFTKNGQIDEEKLKRYAEETEYGIIEELSKWEVKKDEKRVQ